VKDRSLRIIEVAVPVTLHATVHVMDDAPDAAALLRAGLGFLRGLGSHRRRGLGRARFALEEA
jgi:hypothetical protein